MFVAALCAVPALYGQTLLAQNGETLDDLTQLLAEHEDVGAFREAIARGIADNPLIAQRRANTAEAQGAKREARSAIFPTIDLAVSANRAIAREFSNDPDNVIEWLLKWFVIGYLAVRIIEHCCKLVGINQRPLSADSSSTSND